MNLSMKPRFTVFLLSTLAIITSSAQAYLGDFEVADGYLGVLSPVVSSQNLGTDWQDGTGFVPATLGYSGTMSEYMRGGPDVTRYNAGEYGVNGGGPGGSAADIVDNNGLWVDNNGGRLTVDASNGASPFNYVTAHGGAAKSGTSFLAIRAIDANLNYDYHVDSRDLGGVNPDTIAGGVYEMGFWFCPGQVIGSGGTTDNIFGLAFKDDAGVAGVSFGYNGQGTIQYNLGGGALWTDTAVAVGANDWSYASITFDTTTDQASMIISAWNDTLGVLGGPVNVFSNSSMGVDMASLELLNWTLDATMDKNFFDDTSMTFTPVPEPSGVLLIGLTGFLVRFRRRRL